MQYVPERFTHQEQAVLRPYFTNLDAPVFALVNLPEVCLLYTSDAADE